MKISTIKSIWWHLTLVPVIVLGLLLIYILGFVGVEFYEARENRIVREEYSEKIIELCEGFTNLPVFPMTKNDCYNSYMSDYDMKGIKY